MSKFHPTESLENDNFLLRKITKDDFDELLIACADTKIWEQTPYPNRHELPIFSQWFDTAIEDQALVIVDKHNNELIGSSRYYESDTIKGEVAIGYTFLVRKHWGGETNRNLKSIMLSYAWKHFETVWLHIAEDNLRSRKAAEKLGAQLDHVGIKSGLPYCWYIVNKEQFKQSLASV